MAMTLALNTPPSKRESLDIEHTCRRLRMMEGRWYTDLLDALRLKHGLRVAESLGPPMVVACPLREAAEVVSVLYQEIPEVKHPDLPNEVVAAFSERLRISGLWLALAKAQKYTEALNESAVFVEYQEGSLLYRIVTPDVLEGASRPATPGAPSVLVEWRLRQDPSRANNVAWFGDVYDISGDEPRFFIINDKHEEIPNTWEPVEGYPWKRQDGTPFIPASLRHCEQFPAKLFNPYLRSEIVDGTYAAAMRMMAMDSAFFNQGIPRPYTVNLAPTGTEQVKDANGNVIANRALATPGAFLQFESVEDGKAPMIGVLDMGAPIKEMQETYEAFIAQLASSWGISSADLWRADGRSGAALTLLEGGKRRVQAARAPIYRDADERLVGIIAAFLNINEDIGLPETGWQITYTLSPLSPQERAAIVAEARQLWLDGAITQAEYRSRVVGESIEMAQRNLPKTQPPNTNQ